MLARLKFLPIRLKVALLPLVPVLCMLGVALVGTMALRGQGADLNEIVSVNVRGAEQAQRLKELIVASHEELYRLTTWTLAGVPENQLKQATDAHQAAMQRVDEQLRQIETTSVLAGNAAELKAIAAGIANYRSFVDQVLGMIAIEANGAISFLWSAQTQFEETAGQLDALVRAQAQAMDARRDGAAAAARHNQSVMLGLTAVALVFASLISVLIGGSIARPVQAMTAAMRALANGRLDIALPAVGQRNELAGMANAVEVFRANAIQVEESKHLEAERQRQIEENKRETMLSVARDIEGSVRAAITTAETAVEEIQRVAQAVQGNVDRTNRQSTEVSRSSEQTSANVETVAKASERLVVAIRSITDQVGQSSEIAQQAVDQAASTDATVQNLLRASNRISDTISLIGDIATQTNLLALNATIEAARAGDVGRGFAVVATEVKKLASQTATATEEIVTEINAIRTETQSAIEAIKAIQSAIQRVDGVLTTIEHSVSDQGIAIREINSSILDAAQSTRKVSHDIHEVHEISQVTGESATAMRSTADLLNQEFTHLLSTVDSLVHRLKAA